MTNMIETANLLDSVILGVLIAAIGATVAILAMAAWAEIKFRIRHIIRGELSRERKRLEKTIEAERKAIEYKIERERDKGR